MRLWFKRTEQSTAQNRVAAEVLSRAKAFGHRFIISNRNQKPNRALTGTAGGDQLAASLGAFASQIAPGMRNRRDTSPRCCSRRSRLCLKIKTTANHMRLIQRKGFGGNNATAAILSPEATATLLKSRHGAIPLEGVC